MPIESSKPILTADNGSEGTVATAESTLQLCISRPGMELRLHPGLVRERNEDWAGWRLENGRLACAVCDGLGGLRHGDLASKAAVSAFLEVMIPEGNGDGRSWRRKREPDLGGAFLSLQQRILALQEELDEARIGTTLTGVCLEGERLWMLHLGDSRAYLLRGKDVLLLSRDHSLVSTLGLSEEMSAQHPLKHVVTRMLGKLDAEDPDTLELKLAPGDRLLLCTDGLVNAGILSSHLRRIAWDAETDTELADRLLQHALDQGAPDNVCLALITPERLER